MLFGHNTNVAVGGDVIHVQTEDRGANHAFVDTTVLWNGRVLHRRSNPYRDLLPLDSSRELTLKMRIDNQHRTVIEEIRSGALKLVLPDANNATKSSTVHQSAPANSSALSIELLNPDSWRSAKLVSLHLAVRDVAGQPLPGVEVRSRAEGAEGGTAAAMTGATGEVCLQFEMPAPTGTVAALVIEAMRGAAHGQLRFQLRAKVRS